MKIRNIIALAALSILVMVSYKSANAMTAQNKDGKKVQGVYVGILPCADCEGIQTAVKLNEDMSYVRQTRYLGKEGSEVFETSGTYTYDKKTKTITLLNENRESPSKYHFQKKRLTQLDMSGKKVEGELAGKYIMPKRKHLGIANTHWQLVELQGKPVNATASPREPFLMIKTEESRVTGNGSCNTFTGSCELNEQEHRIKFSKIASTKMACFEDMDIEQQFFNVLEHVDNYSINGNRMTLNRARMAPSAVFKAIYVK